MTGRVRCVTCGAESFGRGAVLHCGACYAALLAALEAVEWVDPSDEANGEAVPMCPWCGSYRDEGHRADCRRQLAVRRGRRGLQYGPARNKAMEDKAEEPEEPDEPEELACEWCGGDAPYCSAVLHPGWICSRSKGHEGDHVSCSTVWHEKRRWPQGEGGSDLAQPPIEEVGIVGLERLTIALERRIATVLEGKTKADENEEPWDSRPEGEAADRDAFEAACYLAALRFLWHRRGQTCAVVFFTRRDIGGVEEERLPPGVRGIVVSVTMAGGLEKA